MAKGEKIVRQRAYWEGKLVTILSKGRRKSTIRTAYGYVEEDVPNNELDFGVDEEQATLKFEPPHS